MSVIATLLVVILVIFFRPKYRRIQAEKGVLLNAKTNGKNFFILIIIFRN